MPLLLLLQFLCFAVLANDPPIYASIGSYEVKINLLSLEDKSRNRSLPVKVYSPINAGLAPAVIFSHGLGGSREGGAHWGQHWASHGIVSVHVQHPGSDESLWVGKSRHERLEAMRQGMGPDQLLARVADVKFVLARLDELKLDRTEIDKQKLGMAGHSFGAITTQTLMGQRFPVKVANLDEPRFVAGLAFSPSGRINQGLTSEEAFKEVKRPFMGITGTLDGDPFNSNDRQTQPSRLAIIRAMPAPNKLLYNIEGADHMTFNGTGVAAHFWPHVRAASTAYWLGYLNADKTALAWLKTNTYLKKVGDFEVR